MTMEYDNMIDDDLCENCGMPKDPDGCASCEDLQAARGSPQPTAVMHYNPGMTAD